MAKSYNELAKQAEKAVRGIRDKELRKEAFRILLLQLMAGKGAVGVAPATKKKAKRKAAKKKVSKRKATKKKAAKRKTTKKKTVKRKAARRKVTKKKAARRKVTKKKAAKRPGRAGGGVVTTTLDRLIASGYFRYPKDAATIFKEFKKRRVNILPSQLRMELLRFVRSRKLKRKVKMKGKKVTYLYSK